MIWKITRPQFWILDRQIRRLPGFVIPVGIMLLGLGGQWLYTRFLQEKLAVLNSEQGVAAAALFLPSFFFIFLFAAVLGLGDILYQLYLASDLELLMAAPVPNRTIFIVKLIQCGRATVLPAILAGGLLVTLGLAQGADVSYYLLILLLLLAVMALVTAVIMSLVILLGRLVPPQKARAWLPLALALLSLLILPLQQPALQWFMGRASSSSFSTGLWWTWDIWPFWHPAVGLWHWPSAWPPTRSLTGRSTMAGTGSRLSRSDGRSVVDQCWIGGCGRCQHHCAFSWSKSG